MSACAHDPLMAWTSGFGRAGFGSVLLSRLAFFVDQDGKSLAPLASTRAGALPRMSVDLQLMCEFTGLTA